MNWPCAGDYQMFAALQNQFDQTNIRTCDLSGPHAGWVTWFNSPVRDGSYRFPSSGGLVPSVDGTVSNCLGNGMAPGKLGIAVAFYGSVWTGGAGPAADSITRSRQPWITAPAAAACNEDPAVKCHNVYNQL